MLATVIGRVHALAFHSPAKTHNALKAKTWACLTAAAATEYQINTCKELVPPSARGYDLGFARLYDPGSDS